MIEVLKGFPADVLAVRCNGFVSKADYDGVLVPAVERALRSNEHLSLYYEVAPDFTGISPGAMWEDFRVGIQHLARWHRVAVVSDVPWVRQMAHLLGFLLPARTKVFSVTESTEARFWLTEDT